MNINKDIKSYLKSIRLLLPAHSYPEKEFLTDIENRIQDIGKRIIIRCLVDTALS